MSADCGDAVLAFFGCFSPPTNGHFCAIGMGCDYLTSLGYNVLKAVVVPAHGGYNKPGLFPGSARVAMCRLMAAQTGYIEVDSVEVDKSEWSHTIDTLQYLRAKYSGARIFMLCGIDTIECFQKKWRKPDVIRIIEEFGLVVLPRHGSITDIRTHCSLIAGREQHVHVIGFNPLHEVSSTLVRGLLAQGRHVTGLISPEVERYISENGLMQQKKAVQQ